MMTSNLRKALDNFYSKEILFKLYKKYYLDFIAEGIINSNLNLFEIASINENTDKSVFLDFIEQMFSNEKIFKLIYGKFPEELKKAFIDIAWNLRLYIKPEDRLSFFNGLQNYDLNKDLKVEFLFFKVEKDPQNFEYLYMDYDIVRIYRKFLPKHKNYFIHPIKELKMTLVQNNETEFLSNMHNYLNYFNQGEVKFAESGKVLKESKVNMYKYCKITEFYTEQKDMDYFKTEIIAIFLYAMQPQYRNNEYFNYDNIKQIISDFFNNELFNKESFLYESLFLSFLKSIKIGMPGEDNYPKAIITIKKIIDEIKPGIVVSLENIENAILYRDEFCDLIGYDVAFNQMYINEANYERTKLKNYEQYIDFVIRPFIKSVFFILGTLGLFELYYEYPEISKKLYLKNKYLSRYDGLKYVKLTSFGEYAFSKKENNNFNYDKKDIKIILDEDRLIVTLIGDSLDKKMFLSKISTKISEEKFKITNESFLQGINNLEELKNRILEFKEKINEKLPDIWKNFFEDIKISTSAVVINTNMIILKLENKKEIIDIVLKDLRFRDLVFKAENYYLLVKNENLEKVISIFKEYNYNILSPKN